MSQNLVMKLFIYVPVCLRFLVNIVLPCRSIHHTSGPLLVAPGSFCCLLSSLVVVLCWRRHLLDDDRIVLATSGYDDSNIVRMKLRNNSATIISFPDPLLCVVSCIYDL